jgi:hypothetical protein
MEYRTYLAKNVKPNTWIYADYTADEVFGASSILQNSSIYFTKAGTTDQWAFRYEESRSRVSTLGMRLPVTGEKGLVQQYFLVQGTWELERSPLFFPRR